MTPVYRRSVATWMLLLLAALLPGIMPCNRKEEHKKDECGFTMNPTLKHRLPEGRPVYGVQPIGQNIYVIRDSTPYIEVYDRDTFSESENITLASGGPYDMVQSDSSLFIADWFDSQNLTVFQVENGLFLKWSFQETQFTTLGLAGSNRLRKSNVLVTAAVSQRLKEFSPDGTLLDQVVIANISRPRQAIRVAADRYAVCHGYGDPPELHRVCLVDGDGSIARCYGGLGGSGTGQLNVPARLELSSTGCILVADSRNKRVVLLNKDLEYVRDLIDSNLNGPVRLFLDEVKGLLYIADNSVDSSGIAVSGRVLVFQVK